MINRRGKTKDERGVARRKESQETECMRFCKDLKTVMGGKFVSNLISRKAILYFIRLIGDSNDADSRERGKWRKAKQALRSNEPGGGKSILDVKTF